MQQFHATTAKGAEFICRDEIINKFSNAQIQSVSTKCVHFALALDDLSILNGIHTADDIQLVIGFGEFNRTNIYKDIKYVSRLSLTELPQLLNSVSKVRELTQDFNITVTKTEQAGIPLDRVSDALKKIIQRGSDLKFNPTIRENIDIKIFVNEEWFFITVRIFEKPLYYRDYRSESAEAALRPSLAAVLLHSTGLDLAGLKLLDPMCGGGTILTEGFLEEMDVFGGDLVDKNVEISQTNLINIKSNQQFEVKNHDAKSMSWENDTFDVIATNPPWGKIIKSEQRDEVDKIVEEYMRVLKPTGYLRILTPDKQWLEVVKEKSSRSHKVYTLQLGHLGQTPLLICCNPVIKG